MMVWKKSDPIRSMKHNSTHNWAREGELVLIFSLILLVSGCQTVPPTQAVKVEQLPVKPTALQASPPQSIITSEPTQKDQIPTPISVSADGSSLPSPRPTITTELPAPDPLHFVFPTPVEIAVSAWRPPLYPTPWAPTPYDHFFFSRPIAADDINWPVATYRYGGEFFEDTVHTGVDIPAPKGTPVIAAGSGKVIWAGYGVYRGGYDKTDPYGLAVTIRHNFGYQNQTLYTIYGHLDQIDVAEGQYVETGDFLGLVGETGNVTGPHLHFELRVGENSFFNTQNPELWIAPPQGWGVLAGRVMDTNSKLISNQLIIMSNPDTGQNWVARSYGPEAANADPYYGENLVIGDLPAGTYELRTSYAGKSHSIDIEIYPGLVSYFSFRGWRSFLIEPPPAPGAEYTPLPLGD
jgi:murein DD-endopeptidase MepM/ murein hydrolase activator NlpD